MTDAVDFFTVPGEDTRDFLAAFPHPDCPGEVAIVVSENDGDNISHTFCLTWEQTEQLRGLLDKIVARRAVALAEGGGEVCQ